MLSRPLKGFLPSSTPPHPHPDPLVPADPPEIRPWVCLSGSQGTLVAEQIQVSTLATAVPMLWLRPLLLVWQGRVWELSPSPDLLWPASACQPAYAEAVLPWLDQAQPHDPHQPLLQQFLQHLWASPADLESPP